VAWKPTKADKAFLRTLEKSLSGRETDRVAVLVGSRPSPVADMLEAPGCAFSACRVDVRDGESSTHVALAAGGPFDVIVDDTRRGPGREALFRRTFLHLRRGGTFLVRAYRAGDDAVHKREQETAAELILRLTQLREADGPPTGQATRDELALARAIHKVTLEAKHLLVVKSGASYAKLNEPETNALLAVRGDTAGRVLRVEEPVRFRSRCVVHESPSHRSGGLRETFNVPALSLREYVDVLCAPGQIVVKDNLLLPDTYRHNQNARLRNRFTEDLGQRFAVPTATISRPQQLEGPFFYLDSEFRGHFGHALTEQVSRLWAWPEAKRKFPDLKALMAVNANRVHLLPFEKTLFEAGGIEPQDIEFVPGPVRVATLLAATPMFANPRYVHPDIQNVWSGIGRRLSVQTRGPARPRRIFCSRRENQQPGSFEGLRRACRNGAELEGFFEKNGFTVVFPEEFDLREQARMFRDAEVIAGYAGSAMFNLMFCGEPKHVVLVSSESYMAKNEYLIASVMGHRLHVLWCRPEIERVEGQWDSRAINSHFSFDFEREGLVLQDVLESL